MTIAAVSLGATIASGVVSAIGAISQGQQQSQMYAYQAAVSRNNQILTERAAVDAEQRGAIDEANQGRATAEVVARQRTALAANGVDVNSGSAVDLQSGTAAIGQQAANNIRQNAIKEAYGYRTQGVNYANDAALADQASSNARSNGYMNAFGSILGAGSSVADKWYKFNSVGVNVWG